MRIYYDGPDALITETHFVWRSMPSRSFAVADLHNVQLVQREDGGSRLVSTLAGAGVAALILLPGWLFLTSTAGRLGLVGAAVVVVGLATLRRRTVRKWELQASYRTRETTLYSSHDPRTFNQVARALRRAVESAGNRRPVHRAAAA